MDGDLIVFSRNVIVNGHVKGDILGLARSLQFNGTVDGNIRITCEDITITGTVGKNVTDWSGHLISIPRAKSAEVATVGAGDASLDGHIGGDLLAFLGELEIDGSIGGNARIQGRRLTIGSGAVIAGATHFEGRNPAEVAAGAKLGSPIVFVEHKHGPDRTSPLYYWHQVLMWGASFVFGLALLLVAPGFFYDVANACKRVGPTSGLGVLFLLATPVAAVLICITIVGIPVGIATMLLYVIAVYSAQVFVGTWLGEKILGRCRRDWSHAREARSRARDPTRHSNRSVPGSFNRLDGRRLRLGRARAHTLQVHAPAPCARGGLNTITRRRASCPRVR